MIPTILPPRGYYDPPDTPDEPEPDEAYIAERVAYWKSRGWCDEDAQADALLDWRRELEKRGTDQ